QTCALPICPFLPGQAVDFRHGKPSRADIPVAITSTKEPTMKNKEHMNMTPHGLTVLRLTATLTLSTCGSGNGGGSGGGAPLPPKLKLSNFQPAAVVIGQADFAGIRPNQNGAPDANTLQSLYGNPAVSDSGTLFIGDYGNHRVLAYNTIPTVNN